MTSRAAHEINVDRLIGRAVHDRADQAIGRIAEVIARKEDDEIVVASYVVGPRGWLRRFAVHGLGLRLRSLAWSYRVDWDQLDLSDPTRPALTCARDELWIEYLPPRKRGLTRRPGRTLN